MTVTLSLLASAAANAQHKIGYINIGDLVSVMPETKHAQEALQASADSLSKIDANLQRQFAANRDAFFRDSATMDTARKEAQRRILQKLLAGYQQVRADAKEQLDSTQQALTIAIEAKAQSAVTAAAKANGYTYVFRKLAGADNQQSTFMLVAPEGDDLLPLVKKQLGLPQ